MTNLEDFLNKRIVEEKVNNPEEMASGSFSCQNKECEEIVNEGYIDRAHNRLKWTCSQGHDSAVSI